MWNWLSLCRKLR